MILNDIASTHLYFKYFKELYSVRVPPDEIPEYNPDKESVYVNALLQAYSEHGDKTYNSFLELDDPYRRHFNNSRNDFYFASSLEVFMREVFKEDNFKALKSYISSSIEPVFYEEHNCSFIRCNAVLKQAVLTPIAHSVLSKICEANDKKGVCHHLVNDGEFIWKVK
ncbi:ABC-three component system protein [Pantoea alhagi]|uniref:ABC-three component system protein n=1 Tax=Pantoea alhagi TaxID=1891675 RepID=UPI003AAF821B